MVVMNASAMPDPKDILLLSHVLSYLNLYVESDYAVVFFAAGGSARQDGTSLEGIPKS
ncbi:hypothetical protein K435DRAFT_234373 [Dendrothele bispora CBS 962.96]|uniref:Uncharacterized protein n=1 Tax=Dendrothele bispora (strain CBS 962.96) TaxID=1314807 RepID=A0A4S8LQD5_DENBC|nr:hypothetical protein K435DRAFT_234373 [Dendrothele bispora CBS 962.96]